MKKETLVQVFSCEFCEISKNSFCYRTPVVAALVSLLLLYEGLIPKIVLVKLIFTFYLYQLSAQSL